ncbi:hypothetical protein C8R44DRAFT_728914 [Mycena epipterygia]|nr:hypothetical protein C8R44DRAFT_728914 [Mycena epipterygia]
MRRGGMVRPEGHPKQPMFLGPRRRGRDWGRQMRWVYHPPPGPHPCGACQPPALFPQAPSFQPPASCSIGGGGSVIITPSPSAAPNPIVVVVIVDAAPGADDFGGRCHRVLVHSPGKRAERAGRGHCAKEHDAGLCLADGRSEECVRGEPTFAGQARIVFLDASHREEDGMEARCSRASENAERADEAVLVVPGLLHQGGGHVKKIGGGEELVVGTSSVVDTIYAEVVEFDAVDKAGARAGQGKVQFEREGDLGHDENREKEMSEFPFWDYSLSPLSLRLRKTDLQMNRTNMTVQEMIPDTVDPTHDARFWCLPPMRENSGGQRDGRFPMYLVSQGHSVGIWRSWTVVKAMVDGFPAGAQCGHHSVEACVQEWQAHCRLGVHPHPPEPNADLDGEASPASTPPSSPPSSPRSSSAASMSAAGSPVHASSRPFARENARPVPADLQVDLIKYCRPAGRSYASTSTSESTLTASSVMVWRWEEVPAAARFYAIWEGGIVYGDRADAKAEFLMRQARARILSTELYEESQAFAEGVYWIKD